MELQPCIDARVIPDAPTTFAETRGDTVSSLVFSPGPLRKLRLMGARVFQGQWLPKSVECQRLQAAGFPVPKWAKMTPKSLPSVEPFGQYVVVKPDIGARGADVRIARSTGLTWRPPKTSTAKVLGGPFAPSVVQEFIYSGPWPRSYRVTTLFGEVLWSVSVEASHALPRLNGRNGFAKAEEGAGTSIVSSGKDCTFALSAEPDLMELARGVHGVFPEIPLLGIDFVRDFETGRPYIVEVNSAGLCWHFTSPGGLRLQREMGFNLEAQFDGRRCAAKILAERTIALT